MSFMYIMPLNIEQTNAIEDFLNFTHEEEGGSYLLKGSAGTGKTFTVKHIINKIGEELDFYERKTITLCAPTHKALKVVIKTFKDDDDEKNEFNKFKFIFQTTSRLLRKKKITTIVGDDRKDEFKSENYDYKNKTLILKETYKMDDYGDEVLTETSPFDSAIIKNGIYIIDECSMIDDDDYELLEVLKRRYNLKILYIGDWAQLAPIYLDNNKTKLSKTLTKTKRISNLVKTERTGKKDLFNIYQIFRNCVYDYEMNYKEFLYPYLKKNVDSVTVMTTEKVFLGEIKNIFDNHGKSCILSHTNNKVKYYNDLVKKLFSEKNEEKGEWSIGDRIVFNGNYESPIPFCRGVKIKNPKKNGFPFIYDHWPCRYINNNDYGFITSVEEVVYEDKENYFNLQNKKDINVYKLGITLLDCNCPLNDDVIHTTVYKVFEKDKERFRKYKNLKKKEYIKYIKNPANRVNKKEEKILHRKFDSKVAEVEAPFLSAYATTIRKSQGSTFDTVFIDTRDLEHCSKMPRSDKARTLYTAVTRASCNIFLLINFDKNDKKSKYLNEDTMKTCSGCHSTKEILLFVRKSGVMKKTCNGCAKNRQRIRLKNKNLES